MPDEPRLARFIDDHVDDDDADDDGEPGVDAAHDVGVADDAGEDVHWWVACSKAHDDVRHRVSDFIQPVSMGRALSRVGPGGRVCVWRSSSALASVGGLIAQLIGYNMRLMTVKSAIQGRVGPHC